MLGVPMGFVGVAPEELSNVKNLLNCSAGNDISHPGQKLAVKDR